MFSILTYVNYWNTLFGLIFYWLPIVVVLQHYFRVFARMYKDDLKSREKYENSPSVYEYYDPDLTVGYILGRLLLSIIPVVNLVLAFYQGIQLVGDFLLFMNKILDIPLVPKRSRKL